MVAPKKTEKVEIAKPEFGVPIVWGKRGAGKTLFALNSPYTPVHIVDVENGSADYETHTARLIERGYFKEKFTRVFTPMYTDFMSEMNRISHLQGTIQGTLVIDTIGQVTEWIKSDEFGRNPTKSEKMPQVVWGTVRDRLRNMLLMISKHYTMVILLAHERVYEKIYSPRCNPGVLELTSVSIRLIRDPNKQIPDGLVTYARLPFFPPRIPEVTLAKMLTFIEKPADWDKLSDDQKQPAEEQAAVGIPPEGDDES